MAINTFHRNFQRNIRNIPLETERLKIIATLLKIQQIAPRNLGAFHSAIALAYANRELIPHWRLGIIGRIKSEFYISLAVIDCFGRSFQKYFRIKRALSVINSALSHCTNDEIVTARGFLDNSQNLLNINFENELHDD